MPLLFLRKLGLVAQSQGMRPWFPNVLLSIIGSLGLYLLTWRNLDEASDRFILDGRGDIFDFVIVGAGSAGAVVANRLSAHYNVLLLEAGGEPHPLHLIPSLSYLMVNYPETDWQHLTVPQKHAFFTNKHQECLLSAGKGLGGSSNLNFMMHNRGTSKNWDNIGELLSDSSWSYKGVLPFFKQNECFVGSYSSGGQDDDHGASGEITVQRPNYVGLGRTYIEAAAEMGFPESDLNGLSSTEGFDYIYYPTRNGRKISTHAAFLQHTRNRQTLTIRKYSEVTRVLFKENSTEAYGVEYVRHGEKRQALARREIILSAGAINSPKILMQSGIGPKYHLESLGIDVRKDLPQVGKNLQDHTGVYLGPFFTNESVSLNYFDFSLPSFLEYMGHGIGPFGSTTNLAQGYISSSYAKSNEPDTHLFISGAPICNECVQYFAHSFNFEKEALDLYYEDAKGRPSFSQVVANGRPSSRGELRLRSSNPKMPAIIDLNAFDTDQDIRITIEGIKTALKLAENTTAFQKFGSHFTLTSFPGCHEEEFRSDKYWECYIRQFTLSLHHLVGSCSMAKSEESGGVVDPQMRVFGTQRLRVIDASIIPLVPLGGTNWPTIMVGEKGAQTILDFWNSTINANDDESSSSTTEENSLGIQDIIDTKLRSDIVTENILEDEEAETTTTTNVLEVKYIAG